MSSSKRISVVLPESTILTLNLVAKPGERSRFIDQALQHFMAHRSNEALRAQLALTAIRDIDLEGEIAADWADVDRESWARFLESVPEPKRPSLAGTKLVSRRSKQR